MFNIEQIDANTSAWLTLDGQEYELEQFNINFRQDIDEKGEPQSRVRGGQMLVIITQSTPQNIYDWAMKTICKDGEINFKIESGSSPLRIQFMNANCVGFQRSIDSTGGGLSTAFTIAPEEILINGISFDNRWVE